MTVGDILAVRAHLTPRRIALVEYPGRRQYTFGDLQTRSNRAAHALHDRHGVSRGDRVALLANNSVVYLDMFFGLAKLGAIFTPLNWRLSARELAGIMGDCRPSAIVAGPHYAATAAELGRALGDCRVIAVEGAAIPGAACYEDELNGAPETDPVKLPLHEEDPVALLYTSGTTGQPKGVLVPHRMVLWNAINTVISWGLSAEDVSPVFTPLFHSGGLFAFLMPLLYAGGRVVITPAFDAGASLRVITDEQCTVILGVPSLFRLWMEAPGFAGADFSKVRWFISGGAPCPVPLMQAWRDATGTVLRQGYGLTEAGVNCFSMTDDESIEKAGSVGKPIFHSRMRIVDTEGNEAAPGQPGELLIAGPHLCAGYWQNSAATQLALRDGWLHTGDMARRDEEGFYFIVGRYKDMIISGGENVYAAEVESAFREHPSVADAALIGRPDPIWGEVGVLIVVQKDGCHATQEELLAFCTGKLARFKMPKQILTVDTLPVSPYGKVEKEVLKRRYGFADGGNA